MSLLSKKILGTSKKIMDPAGREISIIEDIHSMRIAEDFRTSVRQVYIESLQNNIYPYRYIRNIGVLTIQEQLKLAQASIGVVGAGGLGGQVILLSARIGIGRIKVIDHDVFDETNLNRQALSSIKALGKSKAIEAADIVRGLNPGVEVIAHHKMLEKSNALALLKGTNVVIDALDSISARFILKDAAKKLRIPIIHGAIAGFEGQVMSIYPEDKGIDNLYNRGDPGDGRKERPEFVLGVPVLAPTVIAAFQVMELIKIILGRGESLRNRMLYIDLESARLNELCFGENE
ncbi:MAG: ThiF family adenylyltransferase [Candidatus Hodarchaeota archaeon]